MDIDLLELDFVRWLAEQYANAHKTRDRKLSLLIVRRTMEFHPVQTAYFCQEMSSWLQPEQVADCLTLYTNRLWCQFAR